jgi:transposase
MARVRQFGTEISANRRRNCEFTPVQKSAMCCDLSGGKSYRAVAGIYNTSPSTVYKIFQHWKNEKTLENKPRSGRPGKLTSAERKYIVLLAKRDRRVSYSALVGAMDGRVCLRTIQRLMKKYYSRKWRAMQRIPLSKETAKIRLRWAKAWKDDIHLLLEVFASVLAWAFWLQPG